MADERGSVESPVRHGGSSISSFESEAINPEAQASSFESEAGGAESVVAHTESGAVDREAARRERNRLSAQKSTGPRFAAGKAISSQNALKHGLRAKAQFITLGEGAEDPDEFTELLAELRQQHMPEGRRQDALVARMAQLTWRLLRVERFEIGAIHRRVVAGAESDEVDEPTLTKEIAECEKNLSVWREGLAIMKRSQPMDDEQRETLRALAVRCALTCPELGDDDLKSVSVGCEKRERLTESYWRGEVRAGLERIAIREEERLEELRGEAERAALEQDYRAERDRTLHALPEPDDIKLVLRYESMLSRKLDRAEALLAQLQAKQE